MAITSFGEKERQQFFEQGYLRLGRVVDPATIQALCDRIDDIMMGTIRYEGMPMQLDSTSGDYGDVPAQSK